MPNSIQPGSGGARFTSARKFRISTAQQEIQKYDEGKAMITSREGVGTSSNGGGLAKRKVDFVIFMMEL